MSSPDPTSPDLLARLLHRDGLMLVVDKPAGLPEATGLKRLSSAA